MKCEKRQKKLEARDISFPTKIYRAKPHGTTSSLPATLLLSRPIEVKLTEMYVEENIDSQVHRDALQRRDDTQRQVMEEYAESKPIRQTNLSNIRKLFHR